MARTLQQLTVFVSGPSDVDAEKVALRAAVGEINRRSEKTHSVTLRILGWPDDVRPGVSPDPQTEINRQVGSDFDIYIGILGSRFGTPTARSGSGTEEEFDRALLRFDEDSTSIRVLFYFKRGPEDPFTLDIPQFERVRSFREGLGGKGILYRDFRDTGEFTTLVREHIDALIIDEWRGSNWIELPPRSPKNEAGFSMRESLPLGASTVAAQANQDDGEDEELGMLDYMTGFLEATVAIVEVMGAISLETQRIGEEIRMRSVETDAITAELAKQNGIGGSRTQQQFLGRMRTTVDRAAENLEDFVFGMTPNVDQYKTLNHAMFDNLRLALKGGAELGPADNTENRLALARLIRVTHESREKTMGFQTSLSRVPALTGRFKKGRRRAAAVLGALVGEMSVSIQEASNLLAEMGGDPSSPAA